jgi:hypothetical protein
VEILDCNGKLVKRAEWKLPWPQLADQLKKEAPAPFGVCFEASCGYGFLFEEFSKVAQQVKAAHPGRQISRPGRSTIGAARADCEE